METLKTITNETIIILSSNKKNRTFRIRTSGGTWLTNQFSKNEFESAKNYWTGNDWMQFMKTDNYTKY